MWRCCFRSQLLCFNVRPWIDDTITVLPISSGHYCPPCCWISKVGSRILFCWLFARFAAPVQRCLMSLLNAYPGVACGLLLFWYSNPADIVLFIAQINNSGNALIFLPFCQRGCCVAQELKCCAFTFFEKAFLPVINSMGYSTLSARESQITNAGWF